MGGEQGDRPQCGTGSQESKDSAEVGFVLRAREHARCEGVVSGAQESGRGGGRGAPLAVLPVGRLDLLSFEFHEKHLNQDMSLGQSVSRLVCVFHILFLTCCIIL